MDTFYIIIFISFLSLWSYFLWIFRRKQLAFFHFLFGCVGLFFLLLPWVRYIKTPFIMFFTSLMGGISQICPLFEAFPQHGILFIEQEYVSYSLFIDLECSGILEIMVLFCLLIFFPVYSFDKRIWISVIGSFAIMFFNITRILCVIVAIYYFGDPVYDFVHSFIGRLLFYSLTIILYFYIFTRTQLLKQKVGRFEYRTKKGEDDS